MATQAQILANRSNAQKSTGPRTAEGKAVVAKNAVKHGLCGQETVVAGEDLGEFEFYRERMLEELDPAGEVESTLAERIVSLSWRLKRAERLQAVAFDSLYAKQKHNLCEKFDNKQDEDGDSTLGRAIVRDFGNNRVLDRLLMYERRIEHSLYRTMAELKRHRILQQVGPGQMWELRRALASEDAARRENHGRDARATQPPAESTGAGRDANSPFPTSDIELHTSPDASCKTKPISPSSNHSQVPANTELTADFPQTELDETKPIPEAEVSSLKFQASSGMALLQTPHFKRPPRVHNKLVANASHVIASGAKQSLTPRVEIASSACSLLAMTSFGSGPPLSCRAPAAAPSGRIGLRAAGERL